ncbi:MAG: hypothetical protein AAGN35_25115 [Bacteroidota bacterium]
MKPFNRMIFGAVLLSLIWWGCDPSKSELPDLVITDLSLNGDNFVQVTFKNEGYGPVTKDTGNLHVFVDGKTAGYALANLANQNFKNVNGSTTITTNFRVAGRNRRIGAFIDATSVITEANEFQNQVAKTITPPRKTGPDLTLESLSLSPNNELRIGVRNLGNRASPPNFPVQIRVLGNNTVLADRSPNLIAIPAGASTVVTLSPPVPINSAQSVRVLLTTSSSQAELDNTNNVREEWLGGAFDLAPYRSLLAITKIAEAIIWESTRGPRNYTQWTAAEKNALDAAIRTLENNGNPAPAAPPTILPGNVISAADAWQIYLAHVAQSLWVDVNNRVPWKLNGHTPGHLRLIFDGRKLLSFGVNSGQYYFATGNLGGVTAWNPKIAYEFLDNFGMIKPSPLNTLYALTDWMRGHLIHISSSHVLTDQFGYPGRPPVDKVLYALDGKKHVTAGCWGTTGLYNAVLRTVNIPVESGRIDFSGGNHSRPIFPSLDRSMPHGDDPYSAPTIPSGVPIPTAELFYNLAEMRRRFIAPTPDCAGSTCNTVGEQASYNAGRDQVELAFGLKGDRLLHLYATRGAAYLDDYFTGPFVGGSIQQFAKPYFEPAERTRMITELEARLKSIGEGDLQAGRNIVQERMDRWYRNK